MISAPCGPDFATVESRSENDNGASLLLNDDRVLFGRKTELADIKQTKGTVGVFYSLRTHLVHNP